MNTSTNDYISQMDKKYNDMMAIDAAAKEAGELKGRVIKEPFADGHAYYLIKKVNKKTVRIVHQDVYDGWVLPFFGKEATIDISYAQQNIQQQDRLAEMFAPKIKTA